VFRCGGKISARPNSRNVIKKVSGRPRHLGVGRRNTASLVTGGGMGLKTLPLTATRETVNQEGTSDSYVCVTHNDTFFPKRKDAIKNDDKNSQGFPKIDKCDTDVHRPAIV